VSIKDARQAAGQPEAVYVNETPAVIDGGRSPTEPRAAAAATAAAAAAGGGSAATTIITEVSTDLLWLYLYHRFICFNFKSFFIVMYTNTVVHFIKFTLFF